MVCWRLERVIVGMVCPGCGSHRWSLLEFGHLRGGKSREFSSLGWLLCWSAQCASTAMCISNDHKHATDGNHTNADTLLNSFSAVMETDWTKNLSRHFASGAGSSFIAWRRTVLHLA